MSRLPEFLQEFFRITDPMNQAILRMIPSDIIRKIMCALFMINASIPLTIWIVKHSDRQSCSQRIHKYRRMYRKKRISKEKYNELRKKEKEEKPKYLTLGTMLPMIFFLFCTYAGIIFQVYEVFKK